MNPPTAATTGTAWAQARRTAEPFVRPPGATSAGPFQDLLAAFAPAPERAAGAESDLRQGPHEQAVHEAEAEPTDGDQGPSQSGDEHPVDASDQAPADADATAADDTEASPPDEPAGWAGRIARTVGQAAEQELAHAANVDLARIARDQLIADPASQDAARSPGTVAPPKQPGKQELVARHGPGQTAQPPVPPDWSASAEPPPSGDATRTPPTVTPGAPARASAPTPPLTPEAQPAPADPKRVSEASGSPAVHAAAHTRASGTGTKPETAPVAISRTALLERLTTSAEAGRGAVAATERVGQQAVGREAERAQPTPSPDNARQTREAVLNTVQRGLASVLTQGGGRMTVVLRPERLGEVRVRLETNDGVVNARLAATTDAARQTLESGLDTLRAALEARGVRVESLQIDPAPAEPNPQVGSHPGQAGPNPDGQQHPDDRRHRPPGHAQSRTETVAPVAGLDDRSPAGIWTELGLDAIA